MEWDTHSHTHKKEKFLKNKVAMKVQSKKKRSTFTQKIWIMWHMKKLKLKKVQSLINSSKPSLLQSLRILRDSHSKNFWELCVIISHRLYTSVKENQFLILTSQKEKNYTSYRQHQVILYMPINFILFSKVWQRFSAFHSRPVDSVYWQEGLCSKAASETSPTWLLISRGFFVSIFNRKWMF